MNKFSCLLLVPIMSLSFTAALGFELDFSDPDEATFWQVTNDTVMGGVSSSQVKVEQGSLHFSGQLSLANNGGFASVMRTNQGVNLANNQPITLRVNGDGRQYQLRLRSVLAPAIAYRALLQTQANTTSTHQFRRSDFSAVFRGRAVPDAPPLQFDQVVSIGFLLADKQPGDFALEVLQFAQSHSGD